MASSSSAGPSGNWLKLQSASWTTLPRASSLTVQSLPASSGASSSSSNKGKGKARSSDDTLASARRTAPSKGNRGGSRGVSSFLRSSDQDAPKVLSVDVPAPSITEGVVFKPLADATALQVELREMVAGRIPMTEGKKAPGNYIAIDCEMVGLGHLGSESALARVSLVNYHGHVVLDTFVSPRERVTDWRTWVSGVRERDMIGAPTFEEVQKQVASLVEGRVLVGHAIDNDLKVLLLNHPGPMVRDTQKCKALREKAKNKRPGLKKLAEMELGLEIQKGAHSSVTDARATMALYRLHKVEWEKQLRPITEAFRAKTGKRKRNDRDDTEDGGRQKKESFPGGGRKGVSSGLGLIVKKNGVRVDQAARKGAKSNTDAGETGGASGLNWWEEDA